MSRTEELWERIRDTINTDQLVDRNELQSVEETVKTGRIKSEDWRLALEKTLFKEENDGGKENKQFKTKKPYRSIWSVFVLYRTKTPKRQPGTYKDAR